MDKTKYRWFLIASICPFIDILTTILFTSRLGIDMEGNPLFRFLFKEFGSLGFFISYFIAFTGIVFTYYFFNVWVYFTSKLVRRSRLKNFNYAVYREFSFNFCMLSMIIMYFVVYVWNLTVFIR